MSNEILTKDERFHEEEPLRFLYWDNQEYKVAYIDGCLMALEECDLTVEQAKRLRDWLNKVLPNE